MMFLLFLDYDLRSVGRANIATSWNYGGYRHNYKQAIFLIGKQNWGLFELQTFNFRGIFWKPKF